MPSDGPMVLTRLLIDAPALADGGEGGVDGGRIGQVDRQAHGVGAAPPPERLDRLVDRGSAPGQHGHPGPVVGEGLGDGAPHALAPPGDDGDGVSQTQIHRCVSPRQVLVGAMPRMITSTTWSIQPSSMRSAGPTTAAMKAEPLIRSSRVVACKIGAHLAGLDGLGHPLVEPSPLAPVESGPDVGVHLGGRAQLGQQARHRGPGRRPGQQLDAAHEHGPHALAQVVGMPVVGGR